MSSDNKSATENVDQRHLFEPCRPTASKARFCAVFPSWRGDRRTDCVCRALQWIRVEMRVAMHRRGLSVAQELSDNRQAERRASAEGCEAVAQIMDADTAQARGARDCRPGLLEVRAWRASSPRQ